MQSHERLHQLEWHEQYVVCNLSHSYDIMTEVQSHLWCTHFIKAITSVFWCPHSQCQQSSIPKKGVPFYCHTPIPRQCITGC